jgi:hypothetical protein
MIRGIRLASIDRKSSWTSARALQFLSVLALSLPGSVALATTNDEPASPVEITTHYDAVRHETRVQGETAADACMTLQLPGEWRLSRGLDATYALAGTSGAEVEIRVRPAVLSRNEAAASADRHAAALQRNYEEVIGKPVQAAVFETTPYKGVSRWAGTWFDANLTN